MNHLSKNYDFDGNRILTPQQQRDRVTQLALALGHGDPERAQAVRSTRLFDVALLGRSAIPGYEEHRGRHNLGRNFRHTWHHL